MTSAYSPSTPCNRTKPVTSTAITTFIPVRQINDVNCNHHIKVRNNDVNCTHHIYPSTSETMTSTYNRHIFIPVRHLRTMNETWRQLTAAVLIPVGHLTVQVAVTLLTFVNAVAPSTLELSGSAHVIAWEQHEETGTKLNRQKAQKVLALIAVHWLPWLRPYNFIAKSKWIIIVGFCASCTFHLQALFRIIV